MTCDCRKRPQEQEEPSRRKRQHHDDEEYRQEPSEWTGFEGYEWANEWHRNQRGPMVMTVGRNDMQRKANPSWWRSDEEPETYGREFYVEPDDQINVQDILDEFDDLLDIQLSPGNWDFDPYLHGMANGMLLLRAIISGETPEYMEAPPQWGADLYEERKALEAEDNLECSAGFRDGVRLGRDIAGDHDG